VASIVQTARERYQAIVQLQGVRKKKTFRTRKQAETWATVMEGEILMKGILPPEAKGTIKELIDTYEREMAAAGIHWSDTKTYNLFKLKEQIGHKPLKILNRVTCIDYGKQLAKTRGPNGVKERLNYLNKALKWGLTVKGYPLQEQIDGVAHAITALGMLRLAGDGKARNRFLSEVEIDKVKEQSGTMRGSSIDLAAIIDVLRLLPLRIGELCQIEWENLNPHTESVRIKRKHPTNPDFWQVVALPKIAGVSTYQLIAGRDRRLARPFPYLQSTVSSYFWLATRMAGVEDFRLHDLRAHAITWLASNGYPKPLCKALMGHSRDSKVLDEVYTRISPDMIHASMEEMGLDVKAKPRTGEVVPLKVV